MDRPQRVLCFAPYNRWQLHGVWEMTILHGLRLRGAEVRHVFCDGAFSDCDIHWKATNPRTPVSCLQCQASVAELASQLASPYEWVSQHIRPDEKRKAYEWVRTLPREELPQAVFEDRPIADWARKSMHQHFRNSELNLQDQEVEETWRSYLYSTLISFFAARRLFDEFKPDAVFLFNGYFSVIRPFRELALERGATFVRHERGKVKHSIYIAEGDASTMQVDQLMWQQWAGIPLAKDQLDNIYQFLLDRRAGRNQTWHVFNPPAKDVEEAKAQLKLDGSKPVWAVFPSSDDEAAAFKERREGYGDHDGWLEHIIRFAGDHPEIQVVVRAHPNISHTARGTNRRQYDYFATLKEMAPSNVRVVMPEEPVNSYVLMDLASVGHVFVSSTGLEMATMGKHVVVGGGASFRDSVFVKTARSPEHFNTLLEDCLTVQGNELDREVARMAFRYAYGQFFRTSVVFPLVRMPEVHRGEPAYQNLGELLPGKDAGLDRICEIILGQRSAIDPPSDDDLVRGLDQENGFLAELFG